MRRGNLAEERGLARVRITDEGGVRHRAQLEQEMALLAFLAFRVLDRRAVLRTFEVDVAFAALAAFAENEFFAVVG